MNVKVVLAFSGLLVLGGCTANVRPAESGPVEYLTVRINKSENVSVATLQEAAVRQATAGCTENHQGIRVIDRNAGPAPNTSFTDNEMAVQALKDADARRFTSVTVVFRCVSELAMH